MIRKIKWYHKVFCFFIGHKNIDEKIDYINSNVLITNCTFSNITGPIINIRPGVSSLSLENDRYIYEMIWKCCMRCGMYNKTTIKENPNFLTNNEKLIKEIIE